MAKRKTQNDLGTLDELATRAYGAFRSAKGRPSMHLAARASDAYNELGEELKRMTGNRDLKYIERGNDFESHLLQYHIGNTFSNTLILCPDPKESSLSPNTLKKISTITISKIEEGTYEEISEHILILTAGRIYSVVERALSYARNSK